jgi:glycosyltransferase involved in cell wall biosynthesis
MNTPLVTILTPVYNGAPYLAECIESVLKQSHERWEYVLVNNCSTDGTLDVIAPYAAADARVRVVSNQRFVSMPANHNIAFGLMSPQSVYCKVVSADDWITPHCIERLVAVAESHPSVGIVGSYQQSADQVRWTGLSPHTDVIAGREVCRRSLLGELDVFGTPTSSLYRSSVVRARAPFFFPHEGPHADTSACYAALESCDFGFVHEVLSAERVHDDRVTARAQRLSMAEVAYLELLLQYGPVYLTAAELEGRTKAAMERYYRFLAGCVVKMKGRAFWSFHDRRMKELGHPIPWRRVMQGAGAEVIEELRHPSAAWRKLLSATRTRQGSVL